MKSKYRRDNSSQVRDFECLAGKTAHRPGSRPDGVCAHRKPSSVKQMRQAGANVQLAPISPSCVHLAYRPGVPLVAAVG